MSEAAHAEVQPSDMEESIGAADESFQPGTRIFPSPPNKRGNQSTNNGDANGTNGTEKESDGADEDSGENGEANGDDDKDKTEEDPMDTDGDPSTETAEPKEEAEEAEHDQKEEGAAQEATPKRRSTRGSQAARTPSSVSTQSQSSSSASRKRGAAADSLPPKRTRRTSKETTVMKVEDMDLKPSGKTPAAQRTPRSAKKEEGVKEDPFDFQSNANKHPEPMANIGSTQVHVQKKSPGQLHYTVTPKAGSSKYAHTERIASERRGEASDSPLTPLSPGKVTLASVGLSTPSADSSFGARSVQSSKSDSKPRVRSDPRSKLTFGSSSADEDEAAAESASQKSSASRRSRKSQASDTPKKSAEEEPPTLTAEEQLSADHPDEGHTFMVPGARVFAQWAAAYYPAIICRAGVDGLNRYSVYYVEDKVVKMLPNNAVIPLSKLKASDTLMFTPAENLSPNAIGTEAVIVAPPDSKNAEEWEAGRFVVREKDSKKETTVLWTQLYLRKTDAVGLEPKEVANPLVLESNIIAEPRSARRSRAAVGQSASQPTPDAVTPTRRRGGRTPKSAKKDDLDKSKTSADSSSAAEDAEQEQQSPVASPTGGEGMKTPENSGPPPVTSASARRPSRGSRQQAAAKHGDDGDEVRQPLDFSESSTTPTGTPGKARGRGIRSRARQSDVDEKSQEAEIPKADGDNDELPLDATQEADAIEPPAEEAPSGSKRGGRGRGGGGRKAAAAKSSTKPAKTAAAPKARAGSDESDTEGPKKIFQNRKFVLTSATRNHRAGQLVFNKREYRSMIEQRGGTVIDDFKGLGDNDVAFLIADTHYRTHKYLSALALSVPCVHHRWILECIQQNTFLDHNDGYMLPAGQAVTSDGQIREFEWKPLKGQLMAGKKVWIHSLQSAEPPVIGFVQLWSPIIKGVGAEVILDSQVAQDQLELLEWLKNGGVDILLTDPSCEPFVAEAVEGSENGVVVGSEWVIEALITGECPDTNHDRFKHNA